MSYRKKHYPQKQDKPDQQSMFTPEYDNPGVLRSLPTSRLTSGLAYQRPVNERVVNLLIRDWDEQLLEPLIVSFRDGRFNLVDGQHRVIALRRKNGGSDVMVLCRVYSGLTYEQEAELCFKLDKAKKRLSMAQSVNALLEAGTDPTIKQINRLLKYEGFVWALGKSRGGAYEVTTTQAVISAYNLFAATRNHFSASSSHGGAHRPSRHALPSRYAASPLPAFASSSSEATASVFSSLLA